MHRFVIFVTVAFFTTMGTASGQDRLAFDFGVRAGIPVHTVLESSFFGNPPLFTYQASFKRSSFTAGPTFAAVLYDRLLIQFDALYKPIRFVTDETTPAAVIQRETKGGSWEFPLMFDYRFLRGSVRPYAGGGGIVGQTMSGVSEINSTFFNTGRMDHLFSQFGSFDNQFPAYIANAGVEWNTRHVVLRPEVRYTRWDNSTAEPKRRRDQVEFLIGFSMR
jgi:hypothetical protein